MKTKGRTGQIKFNLEISKTTVKSIHGVISILCTDYGK